MKTIALVFALLSLTAQATEHTYYKCQSGKDFLLFAYDKNGQTADSAKAGFCRLAQYYDGRPYGSYWCWVQDTRTSKTSDGKLAIQFHEYLGDGAHLFTQLNVPTNYATTASFEGSYRLLNRAAKDLSKPIPSAAAKEMKCVKTSANF